MDELTEKFLQHLNYRIQLYQFFQNTYTESNTQAVIAELENIINDFNFFVKVAKSHECDT